MQWDAQPEALLRLKADLHKWTSSLLSNFKVIKRLNDVLVRMLFLTIIGRVWLIEWLTAGTHALQGDGGITHDRFASPALLVFVSYALLDNIFQPFL